MIAGQSAASAYSRLIAKGYDLQQVTASDAMRTGGKRSAALAKLEHVLQLEM